MIKKTYSLQTKPDDIFSDIIQPVCGGAKKQARACIFYINNQVIRNASKNGAFIEIQAEVNGNDFVLTYTTKGFFITPGTVDYNISLFDGIKCKKARLNDSNYLTFIVNFDYDLTVKEAMNQYNGYLHKNRKNDLLNSIIIEKDSAGAKAYDEKNHISFLIRLLNAYIDDDYFSQVEVFDNNGKSYYLYVNVVDLDEFRNSEETQKKYGKDIHGINYKSMLDGIYKSVIKKYKESAN